MVGLLFLLLPNFGFSASEIVLTQKKVAEMVLSNSYKVNEVNLKSDLNRLAYVQAKAKFDAGLSLESGYQLNKFESFSGNSNPKDESYITALKVQKPFSSGTILGLEYTRTSQKSEFSPSATVTVPAQQTQDILGLTLEQKLIYNSFGVSDRATLRAAEKNYVASTITRADELQNLVLESIQAYWSAYVAQETFREALASRERYQKLVESVRKKSKYGYSSPGELSQIQAELEIRQQRVKTESTNYLRQLDILITLLKLPEQSEIKFEVKEELPPLPNLPKIEHEKLRAMRSARLKLEAAEETASASKSLTYPDLSLVGKIYSSGLENTPESAYSEMASGSKPKYYVGVKLQMTFGSGSQTEDYVNKRISRDLAESQLNRQILELKDNTANAERQVQASYAIVESMRTQKALREKASQELQRSYMQGRTDVSILIEALNKYFDSQVQYSRAVGDYQIALNRLAAYRDELIPDDNTNRRTQ